MDFMENKKYQSQAGIYIYLKVCSFADDGTLKFKY